MSNRYKGGVISATPPTTTGGDTGTASGAWTLEQQMQLQAAGLWPSQPIFYIEDVFSTFLYTGTGASRTITNNIDLSGKGGLVWTKKRTSPDSSNLYNVLTDTVRGASNALSSNLTNAQFTESGITAFNSTGFNLGSDGAQNQNNSTQVAWTFRKQAKFFDVVTYTGDNTSSRAISHNLGSVPGCVIVKRTDSTSHWFVWHRSTSGTPNNDYTLLNQTAATATATNAWSSNAFTSTQFYISNNLSTNVSAATYVAYVFAHDAGGFGLTGTDNVISCGSLTADNAGGGAYAGGATVNLGYEPQFVMLKESSSTDSDPNWIMVDTFRGYRAQETSGSDVGQQRLRANTADAEGNAGGCSFPTSTGFSALQLTGGATYIYIAIRRGPMKVPTVGTQVYNAVLRTGTGVAATVTGAVFPPDLVILEGRTDPKGTFSDRLRGSTKLLNSYETAAEATDTLGVTSFSMDGMAVGTGNNANQSGMTYVYWFFRRYPSVFDEVCYTGTKPTPQNLSHNLGVAPELIIVKRCSGTARDWIVYAAAIGNGNTLYLNLSNGSGGDTNAWAQTSPTSSVFTVGDSHDTNGAATTNVAYLFATCPGVSKVGSYTGTGALQTVNCGFTTGARWVMVKRTDSTGDWYVWDSTRGMTSGNDPYLLLNANVAEVTGTNYVDTDTTGFKVTAAAPAGLNANGGTFIFLAIA